jgi:hypothetical protein
MKTLFFVILLAVTFPSFAVDQDDIHLRAKLDNGWTLVLYNSRLCTIGAAPENLKYHGALLNLETGQTMLTCFMLDADSETVSVYFSDGDLYIYPFSSFTYHESFE